jgi:hypothetical protein
MTWVAVAVVGGAVVGGVASSRAGSQAANASQRGTDASISEQRRQYDTTRADFAPQRSIGNSALDQLARLYGFAPPSRAAATESANADVLMGDTYLPAGSLSDSPGNKRGSNIFLNGQQIGHVIPGGPSGRFIPEVGVDIGELRQQQLQQGATAPTTGTPDLGAFFESPDYQFNLAEGQKAIDRSLAARGGALSGASVREGARYASGMASNQFGDFTNRLLTIAGLGSAATSNTAAAGQNMANNNSAALINNANARASSYMTQAQGVNNAAQGGISNYLLTQYLNKPVK